MRFTGLRIFVLLVLLNVANCWGDDTTNNNMNIIKSTYMPPPDNLFNAMDPAIEWTEMAGFPYAGTYTGPTAIADNVFSHFGSEWEEFHPEPEKFIDGGDIIVVFGIYKGVYKATGKSLEARFTHIYTLQNGKSIKFEQFTDTLLFHVAMQQ